ncbi:MAG: outer membrane lipoprotein chaperone LolA [Burkholderiales bacterium]|nr:outer membrane lipoprotein chaperone LolA [Burkholderiales bacterium]
MFATTTREKSCSSLTLQTFFPPLPQPLSRTGRGEIFNLREKALTSIRPLSVRKATHTDTTTSLPSPLAGEGLGERGWERKGFDIAPSRLRVRYSLRSLRLKFSCFSLFCGVLALSLTAPAFAANALDDLRAFVRDTKTVRAEFTQVTIGKSAQQTQNIQGTLLLSRPGKFRWSTEKPYAQLVISDGARVWFFDPDLEQVIVRSHDQALGGTPAALLAGDKDVERAFELTALPDDQGLRWLQARPRDKEAGFTDIKLGFSQGKLAALELNDAFGQKILTRFRYVEYNPELNPNLFTFTPPAGTDIIGEKN